MADRILVVQKIALSLTLILGLSYISQVEAGAQQTIRFYKVNREIQADRIKFTKKKASQSGCHNFRKKARVYKAVQIGYSGCSLYAKKGCAGESIITVSQKEPIDQAEINNKSIFPKWGRDDIEKTKEQEKSVAELPIDESLTGEMTEGIAWYPVSVHRRGAKIGSWSCSVTTKELP